jgi:hypothetical protein
MVIKDAYMYYITFHQPMPDDTARHLIEMVHAF